MVMLIAAKTPGMTASRMVLRIPTTATSSDASRGPMTAPALSPARSTPKARP
jgi:hypothetical protein